MRYIGSIYIAIEYFLKSESLSQKIEQIPWMKHLSWKVNQASLNVLTYLHQFIKEQLNQSSLKVRQTV